MLNKVVVIKPAKPSQTIPAAYISQLSRLRPLDLGRMDKECSHCHALHWFNETQDTSSMRNPTWESCCKQGLVQLQLLPDPPEYLKNLLASTDTQDHHFKGSLRQYDAAFAFTSLGCDIISAEERNANNNRVEGNVPSYAQLYIYDPSYDAQRQSERNENLDNEVIENPSTLLSQWNPFARIYRHAYEILSNRESSRINREDRANSNGSTESGSSYIVISSSMRMHLIKGDDKRTHNLPTMEEVAAAIPIEYIDRNFRDIVLTLRSSSRNDSLRQ
ncbi:hypothetical protein G6F70_000108 [Rhizopus microsporus]|nr:hypothetical protein G6F71_001860 [Rhizopus microsporus]KAG1204802.1 hypothetical protein G6F70_000108 [Rhizopus microsporus]KAG1216276.1 hypothetical protein G6F69_000194 [Rhizopus microsporus]KAG1236206.1 hypothetical protein G6F67_002176 [Rhizopus microsporus]KAG1265053.1 hypothetical protein G6F68_003898 [Rhizopus microsporus]